MRNESAISLQIPECSRLLGGEGTNGEVMELGDESCEGLVIVKLEERKEVRMVSLGNRRG